MSHLTIEIPYDAHIRHKKDTSLSRKVFANERNASEEVQERELKFYATMTAGLRTRQELIKSLRREIKFVFKSYTRLGNIVPTDLYKIKYVFIGK